MDETNIKKSSFKSIKSTILCDYQTYRWFTFLISRPQAKEILTSMDESKENYKKLSKILILQKTFYLISFLFLVSLFFTKSYYYALYGISIACFSYAIYTAKKSLVSELSINLLKNDFNEEALFKKTLYQIGEHYYRAYKIPSLVDAMYATDTILRKTIKFMVVFIIFIFPSSIVNILLCIIGPCLAVTFVMNTDLIYKKF